MKSFTLRIVIEGDVPLPTGRELTESHQWFISGVLAKMKIGESFVYDRCYVQPVFRSAQRAKVKIVTRKLSKGGFRVWRKA